VRPTGGIGRSIDRHRQRRRSAPMRRRRRQRGR